MDYLLGEVPHYQEMYRFWKVSYVYIFVIVINFDLV